MVNNTPLWQMTDLDIVEMVTYDHYISDNLLGCQDQPLLEWYAYNFKSLQVCVLWT